MHLLFGITLYESNIVIILGIVVKCHETRSLDQNRKRARSILLTKLDNLINQENSIEAQTKAILEKKRKTFDKKHEKLRALKKAWKTSRASEE